MQLIKLKAITNGTRHQLNIQKNLLSKSNKLIKNSILGLKSFSGRSSSNGRITVRHKGNGCKSLFRKLKLSNIESRSILICIMYDSFRSSFISLNFDLDQKFFYYSLTSSYVFTGSLTSCSNSNIEFCLGNRSPLKNIPTGSILHNLSLNHDTSGIFARSAGTYCQLIQKNLNEAKLRLPSGSFITVNLNSFGTLGVVSNSQHNLCFTGKAGRNRLLGIRPSVRGIAMNPVDHPHGGRTNGGRPSVTPWGIPTKGKPTVKKF